MDLTLRTEQGLFNHRVAAVIVHNHMLLAQKNVQTNEYYLPGGRIHYGESSAEAIVREMREELGITVTDYRTLWINECFFTDSGTRFHEVGMYYLVRLENTDFKHYEPIFELQEDKRINTYEWLDMDCLEHTALYPLFVKTEIKNPNKALKHIITDELAQQDRALL